MAQAGNVISSADSEPHQTSPDPAIHQPLSAPTANALERPSNDAANSLRSAEEGVSVKSKLLNVLVYSIVKAHIVLPRSRKEDMCQPSQNRTRDLRFHFFIDELHVKIPST